MVRMSHPSASRGGDPNAQNNGRRGDPFLIVGSGVDAVPQQLAKHVQEQGDLNHGMNELPIRIKCSWNTLYRTVPEPNNTWHTSRPPSRARKWVALIRKRGWEEGNTYWGGALLTGIRDKRGQQQKAESGDSRYTGEEISCGCSCIWWWCSHSLPFFCKEGSTINLISLSG